MAVGIEKQSLDHWGDFLSLGIYFALLLAIGIWSIIKSKRASVSGFFLAGRNIPWWPVGLSLFASNIGSEHFIGLAGTGAASGFAVIMFEWNAIIGLCCLGWMFLPVYMTNGVFTMPEYLQRRYGGKRLRLFFGCLSIVSLIFITISVDLYSGALFIQEALGWNIYSGVALLLGITALFVIMGGLNTVIYTDALQVVIMLIGGCVVMILAFIRVGGWSEMFERYSKSISNDSFIGNNSVKCGFPRDDAFSFFRDPVDSDFPWPGLIFRTAIFSMWFWCASQLIVQRALSARTLLHAQGGVVLASFLKVLPMFIMLMPGMISRALYPDVIGCATPEACMEACNNPKSCSNIAYPKLVVNIMPAGLRGLMIATMMSAVVSTLTSAFNSASAVFTLDLYGKLRPHASQIEQLIAGKLCMVVLIVCGVLWIPIMQTSGGGQLFQYLQAVVGYLNSPVFCVFALGMFVPRTNEKTPDLSQGLSMLEQLKEQQTS